MLHLVNGDAAVALLRRAEVPGSFLNWLDVLHDGPVPGGLPPEQLIDTRARFIAVCGWDSEENARARLRARDERLTSALEAAEEIVIWNSHELFDQLHLLQILDALPDIRGTTQMPGSSPAPVRLVLVADYLGGSGSPSTLQEAWAARTDLRPEQQDLGKTAWVAFTASTPGSMGRLIQQDLAELPFLKSGLTRLAEEFPEEHSGLSLTQQRILEAVSSGTSRVVELFRETQRQEPVRFMGDWSFWRRVLDLESPDAPLLRIHGPAPFQAVPREVRDPVFREFQAELTPLGEAVLNGEADWLKLHAHDLWIGGVHLHPGSDWRWSRRYQQFVQNS